MDGKLSAEQGLHPDNTIVVGGMERDYDYYVPGDLGAASIPLVFLLHGGGSSKDDLTGESGFKAPYKVWMDLAESEKFLVVYPEATIGPTDKRNWNDCRADATSSTDSDDAGFIDTLIDRIADNFTIDASRIYVSGTSNGGHMALRLAMELPDRIAAVAPVVAAMPASSCAEAVHPISVLFMNGTIDPVCPYDGGEVASNVGGRGTVLSAEESVRYWVDFNDTETDPVVVDVDDITGGDGSTIKKYTYSEGIEGTQVVLYEIIGGGHVEPSIEEQYVAIAELVLGRQNHDIEMAEEIWNFFMDKQL